MEKRGGEGEGKRAGTGNGAAKRRWDTGASLYIFNDEFFSIQHSIVCKIEAVDLEGEDSFYSDVSGDSTRGPREALVPISSIAEGLTKKVSKKLFIKVSR